MTKINDNKVAVIGEAVVLYKHLEEWCLMYFKNKCCDINQKRKIIQKRAKFIFFVLETREVWDEQFKKW